MKTSFIRLIAVVALAAITGCASTGSSNPTQLADKVKKGMTKEQVTQAVGKPSSRYSGNSVAGATHGDADEVWIYSDAGINAIPIVSIVRGGRTNTLQIGFRNGKVTQISESTYGLW